MRLVCEDGQVATILQTVASTPKNVSVPSPKYNVSPASSLLPEAPTQMTTAAII